MTHKVKNTAWLFAGQGTIKIGSGLELYQFNDAFRSGMSSCDEILLSLVGKRCSDILYPTLSNVYSIEQAEKLLMDNKIAQPILVCFEYSLFMALNSLGHHPDAIIGHSLGEYAAIVADRVLPLEECLKLVCTRAQLVCDSEKCRGVMYAVRTTADQAKRAVAAHSESVSIAAINGSRSLTLSGSSDAVDSIRAELGCPSIKLNVHHAFHSPLMRDILDRYEAKLKATMFQEPSCTFVSTVLGRAVRPGEVTSSQYWLRHLTDTVLFDAAVKHALDCQYSQFIEIGPDLTLSKLATVVSKEHCADTGEVGLTFTSGIDLVLRGVRADPASPTTVVEPTRAPALVAAEAPVGIKPATKKQMNHPQKLPYHRLIHSVKREEFSGLTVIKSAILPSLISDWAGQHVIGGRCVFPGGAFLDLAVASSRYATDAATAAAAVAADAEDLLHCEGFLIKDTLALDDIPEGKHLTLLGTVEDGGRYAIHLKGADSGTPHTLLASCQFTKGTAADFHTENGALDASLTQFAAAVTDLMDMGKWYAALPDKMGMTYGDSFQLLESVAFIGDHLAQSRISLTRGDLSKLRRDHVIPPTVLDAVFQTALAVFTRDLPHCDVSSKPFVPYAIDNVWVTSDRLEGLWDHTHCTCDVLVTKTTANLKVFTARLKSADGATVVLLKNVFARALGSVDTTALETSSDEEEYSLLTSTWIEKPLVEGGSPSIDGKCVLICESQCDPLGEQLYSADKTKYSLHFNLDQKVDFQDATAAIVVVSLPGCTSEDDFLTLLPIVQVLKECCQNTRRVLVYTRLPDITSEQTLTLFKESLKGLVLSMAAEYPDVIVSIVFNRDGTDLSPAVILRELQCSLEDSIVQYTPQGQRTVPRYQVTTTPTKQPSSGPDSTMDTVIITGGLGALGLQTARVLVTLGARNIVLVSRSLHSHEKDPRLKADLDWLKAQSCVTVLIVECDVSVEASVIEMLKQVRELTGGINGIVHSAGVLKDGLLAFKSPAEISDNFNVVWRVKALGALWLHKHTQTDSLKVFWTFSSITAAIGNAGQVLYGGANALLDSLAAHRRAMDLTATSIRWPAVSDIGMAAKASVEKRLHDTPSISPATVMEILTSLWQLTISREDVPAVLTVLPEGLKKGLTMSPARTHFTGLLAVLSAEQVTDQAQSNAVVIKGSACLTKEQLLSTVVTEVSKLMSSSVSVDDNLMETGLDSMGATELSVELSNRLNLKLLPTLALSHGSITEIVNHLWEQLRVKEAETSDSTTAVAGEGPTLRDVVQQVRACLQKWAQLIDDHNDRLEDGTTLLALLSPESSSSLDSLQALLSETLGVTLETSLASTMTVRQVIEKVVQAKGFAQALLASADIQSVAKGDIYRGNPWFANYFTSAATIRGRVILFGGLAQPTISWYGFAKVMNEVGLHVHVVRLPGRFDRPHDVPLLDSEEITESLCKAMTELGFLDLPLFCFGYSYGALMAYCCSQYLEHRLSVPVKHFICISGPHRSQFDSWRFMDPQDRDVNTMKEISIHNLGSHNPNFDMNFQYMPDILEYFFTVLNRDYDVCKSWVKHYDQLNDEQRRISCDVTCIAGEDDKCVNNRGWQDITGGNYQQTFFPGDHFFIFTDSKFDQVVATECCRAMLRSLRIYM